MTGRVYLRAIVPIGLLYSGSLVCSNLVYLYLSVSFIQMLKAGAPVAVLIISWIWGVAEPSMKTFYNVLLIVAGVALASFGEIEFSWIGFIFQMGGIVFEGIRLVMIQVLLKGDESAQKMDPLVSLYYYAPVCAVMNFFVAWASEFSKFNVEDLHGTGVSMLLLNAAVAFMLNVSSVFLVSFAQPRIPQLVSLTGPTDRQDLRPGHDPYWHPQEHPSHHRLRPHLEDQHHLHAVRRLLGRALRPRHLLNRMGTAQDLGPGRLCQGSWGLELSDS